MTTTPTDKPVILEVSNLTKEFGDLVANDDICIDLRAGEIHCWLGENGAGKSTLAKCLYGAYRPGAGAIRVSCTEVRFSSPKDAIHHGIGMVHQHFVLVPPMSVLENVIAGTPSPGLGPNLKQARAELLALCERYAVKINPDASVAELSVGEQQWVEILKALFVRANILILDEPTAVLTPQEVDKLFVILRQMTAEGKSIIFITHKLNEVLAISDRVTVFRKGRVVATLDTCQANKAELARLMVGRGVRFEVEKTPQVPGEVVLEIDDVHVVKDNGREALRGISLAVREREILGIAGVAGNGQSELFDALVGARRVTAGRMWLGREEITNLTPRTIQQKGLASIPPDRIQQGLLMEFTLQENLVLGFHRESLFSQGPFLRSEAIQRFAAASITQYNIATSGPRQEARRLSGGNLQKVILARELSHPVKCVLASSPTRGLDVGAIEFVHQRLVQLRDAGVGVLLLSEDLDEVLSLADRIAIIFQGKTVGIFASGEVTREQIGLLMAGSQEVMA